jgi:membrane associated rhomboid family serine protease
MWFLWIFGNNIEDIVGHFRFILFYLLGGIAASLLQVLVTADSTIPVIGASGAVSAVLGAYVLKFPRARVRTLMFIFIFVTIINVPAAAFLGIWFFLQVLYSLVGTQSNVAWFAHIGGFIFGLAFIKIFEKRQKKQRYRVY